MLGSRFSAHEVLLSEGERPTAVLVIRSGLVKTGSVSPDGRSVIIEMRGPGETLGEMGVIDGSPSSMTATALGQVDVLVVPAAAFRTLIMEAGHRIRRAL